VNNVRVQLDLDERARQSAAAQATRRYYYDVVFSTSAGNGQSH